MEKGSCPHRLTDLAFRNPVGEDHGPPAAVHCYVEGEKKIDGLDAARQRRETREWASIRK